MPIRVTELNHVAIHVADVAASVAFYGGVLELRQVARPDFDFDGAWFELGDGRQIHLIAGRAEPVHSHNRGTHFAMQVADFDEAVAHIRAAGVKHVGPKDRPDGARQVFLYDPDGHVVELCDNRPADAGKRTKWP